MQHVVTFNNDSVKSIKFWHLLILRGAHCQLCMIYVIYLAGIDYILTVNVLLLYALRVLTFFFCAGGVFVSLLVELFLLCV
jgi:hypothetical protein